MKGDREGRRGPRTKPGESNIKRAKRRKNLQGKRRGKQREREEKPEEGGNLRGKRTCFKRAVVWWRLRETGKAVLGCGHTKATNDSNKSGLAGIGGGGMWIGMG